MDQPRAVFGSPALWDSIFETYENNFRAIEDLRTIARDLVATTKDCAEEIVKVETALTYICSDSMLDVMLLAGNNRGTGAMKIARGMFEIFVVSGYLEKNPNLVHDYLNFGKVEAWRHLQTVQKYSPGRVPADLMTEAEAEFNRVKPQFSNAQGRVQLRWTKKTIREMAEEIGFLNLYELAYSTASELHHMPFTGVIGHDLDWVREALYVAHGSLLSTVVSLSNVYRHTPLELRDRVKSAIANFRYSRKQPSPAG
jgi:hypothetical protein